MKQGRILTSLSGLAEGSEELSSSWSSSNKGASPPMGSALSFMELILPSTLPKLTPSEVFEKTFQSNRLCW